MNTQPFKDLSDRLEDRGLRMPPVIRALKAQRIETPSWGYGNSGTRFKVFHSPGAARTVFEKFDDAALVHKLTGIAPSVAVHIPWDKLDDMAVLRKYARSRGVRIGAVNPNLFQDERYKLGSVCHPDAAVRRLALKHLLECVALMKTVGSTLLSLWLADGTNYAGQDSMRERKRRLEHALRAVTAALPGNARLLIEYKCFEPATYHTDIPDWGTAYALAKKLGPKAQVLIDLGHHLPGANIEQIVAFLLDEKALGGFHFNNRKYADDDLMVGSVNPFELFLIYNEIVEATQSDDQRTAACARNIAFMIDQSHTIEPKLEAMLQSVVNCQTAYAKALIVDRALLKNARQNGDVLGAHRALTEAFETDVRPLLHHVRETMGLHPDPVAAFKAEGYYEKLVRQRG